MIRIFPLLVALCSLWPVFAFAADPASPDPETSSGILGTITIGPAHGGPIHAGEASATALANTAFEVKQGEKVIASFKTDSQGHFKVMLPPGHYTVARQGPRRALGRYGPFEITVSAGKMTSVQWECDTGLR